MYILTKEQYQEFENLLNKIGSSHNSRTTQVDGECEKMDHTGFITADEMRKKTNNILDTEKCDTIIKQQLKQASYSYRTEWSFTVKNTTTSEVDYITGKFYILGYKIKYTSQTFCGSTLISNATFTIKWA